MIRGTAFWVTLGALLAAGVVCGPLWAAEPGASWGVVDMDRVAAEYRGMHELNQQFQEFQREQDELLDTRYKTRALSDEERQEYLDLVDMAAPTAERDKRLAELAELSDTREQRLLALRQQKERDAAAEEEYQRLRAMYDARMNELAALQAGIQQARVAKRDELTAVVTDSVHSAVKAVAEEKRLAIVLRKEMVLHGGTDITDAVLAKLNADEPPKAAQE